MSILNALNTAVSGINAQSQAFTDLSNNIANSSTVGYKATTTSFEDYVSEVSGNSATTATLGSSDSVAATTQQRNDVQGSITTSTNTLALAISGNGFFNVAQSTGSTNLSTTSFSDEDYYTRNGDFYQNSQGYLVNTSGYYLEGYNVGTDGSVSSTLSPIQVSDVTFRPTVATTGDVGSSTATGGTSSSSTTIYDSSGDAHTLSIDWTQSSTDPTSWTVSVSEDGTATQTADVTFDSDGALASVNGSTSSGSFNYSNGTQNVTIDLGTIGSTSGATLDTASATSTTSTYTPTLTTDSEASVNYEGLSTSSDGNIYATFDNGSSQLVAEVPLTTFTNVNGLEAQDGEAYTATASSGTATTSLVGENGAGTLTTDAVEASTTDLTTDLTQLIVAQQAYSANAKVVTAANTLLQTTISMIQS